MTTTNATAATVTVDDPRIQEGFANVKKCIVIYGVMCLITLGTVAGLAIAGQSTTGFEWIRASILLLVTPFLYVLANHAARGTWRSFDRLRTLATILPIAIIVVDLIPGLCPVWYASMQAVSAFALAAVAFLTRTAAMRAAFVKPAA
ncbi:hypothetical protein [Actinoplanes sp. N902-109]|uniref:hypothetical protein n=1 Tax=Actinoplanes sp. (strain N902-109) TaxID=649831 RepID=UPI0003295F86|nr:hypothetical protein [Actinoplanes sp. N902-109]AGL21337.1 hypothetical protein L083_7827 [Actinoplanes sp. N902-109]